MSIPHAGGAGRWPGFAILASGVSIILVFAPAVIAGTGEVGAIAGRVIDTETGLGLAGAAVSILDASTGTVTDPEGRFRIAPLRVGAYAVEARHVGYRSEARTDVIVATGHDVTVLFRLLPQPIVTPEVHVPAPLFRTDPEAPAGSFTLGYEALRRSPGAAEDVSRVMQVLPGVASTSDQMNELVVRGGNPYENLTLWEGIELPNANHFGLLGETGGPISLVDILLVEDTRFYNGAFPARYGDRLSSVLDIRLREGSRTGLAGNLDMSMAGAGLAVEGPLPGVRGSWMASARKSYLDLVHGQLDLTAIPRYQDAQGKVTIDAGPHDRITVAAIGGTDEVTIEEETNDAFTRGAEFDYVRQESMQGGAGIRWHHAWGPHAAARWSLSRTNNLSDIVILERDGSLVFQTDSREGETSIAGELSLVSSHGRGLDVGGAVKWPEFHHVLEIPPEFIYSEDLDSIVVLPELVVNEKDRTRKDAAWAQLNWPLGSAVTASAGLRYDYFALPGRSALGPRFAIAWKPGHATQLSLSHGVVSQAMPLLYYTQDPSNRELGYVTARHWVAGVEYLPRRDLRLTVEGYAKLYDDQVIAPNDYSFVLENDGRGEVFGIETFLEQKMTRGHFLLLSHSWSRARSFTPGHGWFPSPYDYGHVFTTAWGWMISPAWETSIRWRYMGGRRYTALLGRVPLPDGNWAPVYDDEHPYASRHDAYHRLDFRLGYRLHRPNWNLVTYFEIWNIYERRNLWGMVWDESDGVQKRAYQFGFFPVGGVRLEF